MNEKVAKKIGEAYAFAQVLKSTYESYQDVMKTLFGSHAEEIVTEMDNQIVFLTNISKEAGVSDIVLPKAQRTETKISNMADMYVGDEWNNPVEVLEWMSFFIGGAVVHWQLIAGSGEALEHAELKNRAQAGADYYHNLMHQLKEYSVEVGKARVEA